MCGELRKDDDPGYRKSEAAAELRMWADHRAALDCAWFSQAAHLTSQVGKRDKDPSSLSFPKWRGYICPLGPVEWI